MKRMITIATGVLVVVLIGSPLVLGGQMPMDSQGGANLAKASFAPVGS